MQPSLGPNRTYQNRDLLILTIEVLGSLLELVIFIPFVYLVMI